MTEKKVSEEAKAIVLYHVYLEVLKEDGQTAANAFLEHLPETYASRVRKRVERRQTRSRE